MMKLKILLVVHNFWPNFRAGTENATYFLARELAKSHDVTVLTVEPNSDRDGLIESYRESGFDVVKIHQSNRIPKNLKDTYFNEDLEGIFREKMEEISPDIVHFQHLIGMSLKFIAIVKEKNIPIFYTLHDFWFQCPRIRRNYKGKNCPMGHNSKCNSCILNSFLFIDSAQNANWVMKKVGILMKKRFLKRITHILLNQFRLKYILNYGAVRVDLIGERNRDFMEYLNFVDQFISPSQFLKDEAVKFGIAASRIDVISHGIDNIQDEIIKKKIHNKKTVHFCFLSHITRDKGFFLLLDSFNRLLKSNKNIKLSLYGSYDKDDVAIKKALKNIENSAFIEYKGVFDASAISEILANADVVVIPSLWQEIYGLVLDESFNFGVPVIVSNQGGLPERVRDGVNGLIFDPNKKSDLYDKMKVISRNPEMLENMNKNIPRMRSIENYASEIENKYMEKYNEKNGK